MVAMSFRKLVAASLAAAAIAEPVDDAAALVQQTVKMHDQGAQQQAGIKDDLKNLVGVLTDGVVKAVKTKVAADVKAQVQGAQGVNASGLAALSAAQQGGEIVQGEGRTGLVVGLEEGATSAFSELTDARVTAEVAKRGAQIQKVSKTVASNAEAPAPPARAPALPQNSLNMRKRLQRKRQQARNKPTAPPSKKLCPTCSPINDYKSIPVAVPEVQLAEEKETYACTCLNWKEAFTSRGAACGTGLELGKAGDFSKEGACDELFKKLDTNACINSHMGERDGQWCYTSHKCAELNGGRRVPGTDGKWSMNVKMCSRGQDTYLSNHSPFEISTFAKNMDIEVGPLVKMAYPTVPQEDLKWQDVSHFFSNENKHQQHDINDEQVAKMAQVVDSGKPVVWGSRTGRPPFGVTMGMKAYEVENNKFQHGRTHLACKHDCSTDHTL